MNKCPPVPPLPVLKSLITTLHHVPLMPPPRNPLAGLPTPLPLSAAGLFIRSPFCSIRDDERYDYDRLKVITTQPHSSQTFHKDLSFAFLNLPSSYREPWKASNANSTLDGENNNSYGTHVCAESEIGSIGKKTISPPVSVITAVDASCVVSVSLDGLMHLARLDLSHTVLKQPIVDIKGVYTHQNADPTTIRTLGDGINAVHPHSLSIHVFQGEVQLCLSTGLQTKNSIPSSSTLVSANVTTNIPFPLLRTVGSHQLFSLSLHISSLHESLRRAHDVIAMVVTRLHTAHSTLTRKIGGLRGILREHYDQNDAVEKDTLPALLFDPGFFPTKLTSLGVLKEKKEEMTTSNGNFDGSSTTSMSDKNEITTGLVPTQPSAASTIGPSSVLASQSRLMPTSTLDESAGDIFGLGFSDDETDNPHSKTSISSEYDHEERNIFGFFPNDKETVEEEESAALVSSHISPHDLNIKSTLVTSETHKTSPIQVQKQSAMDHENVQKRRLDSAVLRKYQRLKRNIISDVSNSSQATTQSFALSDNPTLVFGSPSELSGWSVLQRELLSGLHDGVFSTPITSFLSESFTETGVEKILDMVSILFHESREALTNVLEPCFHIAAFHLSALLEVTGFVTSSIHAMPFNPLLSPSHEKSLHDIFHSLKNCMGTYHQAMNVLSTTQLAFGAFGRWLRALVSWASVGDDVSTKATRSVAHYAPNGKTRVVRLRAREVAHMAPALCAADIILVEGFLRYDLDWSMGRLAQHFTLPKGNEKGHDGISASYLSRINPANDMDGKALPSLAFGFVGSVAEVEDTSAVEIESVEEKQTERISLCASFVDLLNRFHEAFIAPPEVCKPQNTHEIEPLRPAILSVGCNPPQLVLPSVNTSLVNTNLERNISPTTSAFSNAFSNLSKVSYLSSSEPTTSSIISPITIPFFAVRTPKLNPRLRGCYIDALQTLLQLVPILKKTPKVNIQGTNTFATCYSIDSLRNLVVASGSDTFPADRLIVKNLPYKNPKFEPLSYIPDNLDDFDFNSLDGVTDQIGEFTTQFGFEEKSLSLNQKARELVFPQISLFGLSQDGFAVSITGSIEVTDASVSFSSSMFSSLSWGGILTHIFFPKHIVLDVEMSGSILTVLILAKAEQYEKTKLVVLSLEDIPFDHWEYVFCPNVSAERINTEASRSIVIDLMVNPPKSHNGFSINHKVQNLDDKKETCSTSHDDKSSIVPSSNMVAISSKGLLATYSTLLSPTIVNSKTIVDELDRAINNPKPILVEHNLSTACQLSLFDSLLPL